jgi:hypothetical protein
MPALPKPDWEKLTAAIYPNLSDEERAALARGWSANYDRFAPLKEQLTGEHDPDAVFLPDFEEPRA